VTIPLSSPHQFQQTNNILCVSFSELNIDGTSINDIPRKIYAELGEQEQINEQ